MNPTFTKRSQMIMNLAKRSRDRREQFNIRVPIGIEIRKFVYAGM